MLTEKDYCDYDTCVALKELGFTLDMTEKVCRKLTKQRESEVDEYLKKLNLN